MNIDVNHAREVKPSQCVGRKSDAIPKVHRTKLPKNSDTGVSTHYALSVSPKEIINKEYEAHWFALRTTYGREHKANQYLLSKGIRTFLPTVSKTKIVKGKRTSLVESRIPNIFFAYGTEEQIKSYVYDNVNLPYLRFYYRHLHEGGTIKKFPLVVPNSQMDSLMIICEAEANDVLVTTADIPKFASGQKVKIVDGTFKGVIGKVARYHGQQRVAVTVEGLVTMVTAYIPSAFLNIIV